jgi:U2 small nuclear ribonucleoprotein B''
VDSAQNAIDDLQGFDLFGQQMALDFAKTRSDATVKREDGDQGLETHKKQRLAEKGTYGTSMEDRAWQLTRPTERKQAQEAAAIAAAPAKRAPEDNIAERPGKSAKPSAAAGGMVPDEYLPPNKTLFLRDLPEDYGKDMLAIIFRRYPGFREIRLVPGRNTIAFAEYEDETGATAAKEALANLELSSQKIKITYQRQ